MSGRKLKKCQLATRVRCNESMKLSLSELSPLPPNSKKKHLLLSARTISTFICYYIYWPIYKTLLCKSMLCFGLICSQNVLLVLIKPHITIESVINQYRAENLHFIYHSFTQGLVDHIAAAIARFVIYFQCLHGYRDVSSTARWPNAKNAACKCWYRFVHLVFFSVFKHTHPHMYYTHDDILTEHIWLTT